MRIFSVCLSFLLVFCLQQVNGQAVGSETEVYVQLKEGSKLSDFSNHSNNSSDFQSINPLQAIFDKYNGVSFYCPYPKHTPAHNLYILTYTNKTPEDFEHLLTELNHLEDVVLTQKVVHPEISSVNFVPGDMNSDLMWYINQINMDWDLPLKSTFKVKIAIIDNGVRLSHEDITPNLWSNSKEINGISGFDDDGNGYIDDKHGWDAGDSNGNPTPPINSFIKEFSHGTQVAGIASASTDNSKGMVSIGFNTEIIAVKCAKDNGNGKLLPKAAEGIYYAVDVGADIINLSWGSTAPNEGIEQAIKYALSHGVIVIAAAGNGGGNDAFYPAIYNGVIGVGATGNNDFKSVESNYGNAIDVMAPGVDIYTTWANSDNAYGKVSGTSMATPIVSALAGLLLSQFPDRRDLIELAIKKGCDNIDLNNEDFVGQLGAGRINIKQSYLLMENPSLSVVTPKFGALNIYPNPSQGIINFQNTESLETLEVYDMSGKQITSLPISNNRADLKSLNLKGMYVLRSRTENDLLSARIFFQ